MRIGAKPVPFVFTPDCCCHRFGALRAASRELWYPDQISCRVVGMLNLTMLAAFDEIIDVRTPAEFVLDHIPGAHNFPVLDDAQRAEVGTLYKQTSEFIAKQHGAALIARNIARHLEESFADRPRQWRPLVYCWRGGMRSGSMQHVLRQIGWRAERLDGGYKAYRQTVLVDLDSLPERFRFRVICGATGSGKSRLLRALALEGAQVLDLEHLARHRGSVLGDLPQIAQPAQRWFDSQLWQTLSEFDPARPVFVEAESKKIGQLRLPEALCRAMWQPGRCIRLQTGMDMRVALLRGEYAHFLQQPETLFARLDGLVSLYGHARIEAWKVLARIGDWDALVRVLLDEHYDRYYARSMATHYPDFAASCEIVPEEMAESSLRALARQLIQSQG